MVTQSDPVQRTVDSDKPSRVLHFRAPFDLCRKNENGDGAAASSPVSTYLAAPSFCSASAGGLVRLVTSLQNESTILHLEPLHSAARQQHPSCNNAVWHLSSAFSSFLSFLVKPCLQDRAARMSHLQKTDPVAQ